MSSHSKKEAYFQKGACYNAVMEKILPVKFPKENLWREMRCKVKTGNYERNPFISV